MNLRTCLVHAPGYPLRMEDLMPSALLATLAARLQHEGATAIVIDSGLPEFTCTPGGAEEEACLQRVETFVLDHFDAGEAPALAILHLATRKDVVPSRRLAARIKEAFPACFVVITGDYAEAFGSLLIAHETHFDAAILHDPELAVAEIVHQLRANEPVSGSPNMVMLRDGSLHRGRRALSRRLDFQPLPDYSPGVYPSLYQGKKLHLFTIEQARGGTGVQMGPTAPWSVLPVRVKPPSECVREVEHIWQYVPTAGAFHFSGAKVPSSSVEHLCYELRGLERSIRYSRDVQVNDFESVSPNSLQASGCRAIRMPIYTGSQRLLEDFFGQSFCVSQAERALQRVQRVKLFRIADITFPVPHDDRHTRAETLRIISRTMPEAVSVSPAELRPESIWSDWQDAYGFGISEDQLADWSVGLGAGEKPTQPYTMRGWDAVEIRHETGLLERDVNDLGIYNGISPREALVAWLLELDQCLERFALLQHQALLHEDSAANFVRIFNERTGMAANKMVWFPFHPESRAVSN